MMADIDHALPLERRIWLIRGQRVMLDADLAEIYGVTTKRLNQQVRRNEERFPDDLAFRLTAEETKEILRSQNATLGWGRYSKFPPLALTEHGAVMLSCVLKTPAAVAASLRVIRAFIRLRALIAERDGLGRRMSELEKAVTSQGSDIGRIFRVLEDLTNPAPAPTAKRIGFKVDEQAGGEPV